MKYLLGLLLCCLLSTSAWAQKPTDASIEKLLVLTRTEANLKTMMQQSANLIDNTIEKSWERMGYPPETRKKMLAARQAIRNILREDLTWEKIKPMYVSSYQETFNQKEVDAMIAFYSTPEGQAILDKMPLVMKRADGHVRKILEQMMIKLQEIAPKILADELQRNN